MTTISKTSRNRLLAAGTLLLVATGLGAALLLAPSRAEVPTEAGIISQHCQSFSRFKTWLAFRGGPVDGVYKFLLHAHEDGRIAMDRVTGQHERIYWDGAVLTKANDSRPTPRVIDGYDEIIADVWAECRAGFSSSTWTSVPPPYGIVPVGTKYFMELDLPFAWAAPLDILVGYSPGSGDIQQVDIIQAGTALEHFSIRGPDWNASFPEQALGPQVPPFFPDKYPGWIQRAVIADEILAGAKPEDLLIPIAQPR